MKYSQSWYFIRADARETPCIITVLSTGTITILSSALPKRDAVSKTSKLCKVLSNASPNDASNVNISSISSKDTGNLMTYSKRLVKYDGTQSWLPPCDWRRDGTSANSHRRDGQDYHPDGNRRIRRTRYLIVPNRSGLDGTFYECVRAGWDGADTPESSTKITGRDTPSRTVCVP